MPYAKFRADPLKTVAVHEEQRTDRHTFIYMLIIECCAVLDFDIVEKKTKIASSPHRV